ncbi:hypothetical protein [Bradyrhizobium sp. SZCCHNS2002]|uniref:hypothetical protein n=1 Tax=Bradyrhizobium sp. SZCCHNS2002 TaxID=3057302 RepID=UPI0029171028|nr:hypothetical protein [Bradyrhizobium sp. SZCCHNS2002]
MTTRSDQSCRSLPRHTSWASDRVSLPVSVSSCLCASVMVMRTPFQISSGWLGSSGVRVVPSGSGRARG